VPTFPRSYLISNPERGDMLAEVLGQGRICMMRGHGITAVGATVEQATLTTIDFNDLAEMNYKAAMLGAVHPIPAEDLAEFGNRRGGQQARPANAPARPVQRGFNSRWRYYDRAVSLKAGLEH
jgi:ribulose-5-phosphate 4-epimerase/fuculose-1-phosphate aldolase